MSDSGAGAAVVIVVKDAFGRDTGSVVVVPSTIDCVAVRVFVTVNAVDSVSSGIALGFTKLLKAALGAAVPLSVVG